MDKDSFVEGVILGAVFVIPFLVTWCIAAFVFNEGLFEQLGAAALAAILAFVLASVMGIPEPSPEHRIAKRISPSNIGKVEYKIFWILLITTECLSVLIPSVLAFVL